MSRKERVYESIDWRHPSKGRPWKARWIGPLFCHFDTSMALAHQISLSFFPNFWSVWIQKSDLMDLKLQDSKSFKRSTMKEKSTELDIVLRIQIWSPLEVPLVPLISLIGPSIQVSQAAMPANPTLRVLARRRKGECAFEGKEVVSLVACKGEIVVERKKMRARRRTQIGFEACFHVLQDCFDDRDCGSFGKIETIQEVSLLTQELWYMPLFLIVTNIFLVPFCSYGLSWSPIKYGHLLAASEDTTVCHWWVSLDKLRDASFSWSLWFKLSERHSSPDSSTACSERSKLLLL